MYNRAGLAAASLVAAAAMASAAHADPCTARLPHKGTVFSGPVRYVVDGDGFCLGPSADPASWIEVRVADFYAPELHEAGGRAAKAALSRILMGAAPVCRADHRSYDRIVARCAVDGRDVGDLMRAAGIQEGGRAWPPRSRGER